MKTIINKIKSSLSIRIFLGISTILIVVSLLIIGSFSILMPKAFKNELSKKLTFDLQELAEQLETADLEDFESYATSFAITNNASLSIYDEQSNAILSVKVSVDDYDNTDNDTLFTTTTSFSNSGQIYYIEVNTEGTAINQINSTLIKIFPYILIIIVVLSALAALIYSRFFAKPIVHISNISKKMTSLDMTWQCDINRSDEIGILANNLNDMAISLDTALSQLKTANEQLQKDIARQSKQEKQRQDFFIAISHELKTPVAILEGELEGMIYNVGKYKDRDKYLKQAYETTESMEMLVKEIMELTKLNMEENEKDVENINISDIINECCDFYKATALRKQLSINRMIQDTVIGKANLKNIKKVISNIIGNAVLHSSKNAKIDICLLIDTDTNKGVFYVENSGAHIEEIEQLFEPFYRVDKSRNRDTGGSGLGLYVVKTILDMYQFKYSIKNTQTGVRFTLVFPTE